MENIQIPRLPILLPLYIGTRDIEEGFYLKTPNSPQPHDKRLFYLSRNGNDWYFQFASDGEPKLIKECPTIEAIKVDPEVLLKTLAQEREFIKSRLASLTEKTS